MPRGRKPKNFPVDYRHECFESEMDAFREHQQFPQSARLAVAYRQSRSTATVTFFPIGTGGLNGIRSPSEQVEIDLRVSAYRRQAETGHELVFIPRQ